jgi:hypothetical protein
VARLVPIVTTSPSTELSQTVRAVILGMFKSRSRSDL